MQTIETDEKSHSGPPTEGLGPATIPAARPDTNAPTAHSDQAPVPDRETQVTAAIKELWRKLQVAGVTYDPAATDHGRASAGFALIAVLEFLAVLFPQTSTLPIPLEALLHALFDVSQGTRNPLFTHSKGRGRGPVLLSEQLFRALVAAAMTKRLEAAETSVEMAARDIERRLAELGYRRRRNIQHKQIQKWREKMMEGGIGERGVERYRLALEVVREMQPIEGTKFLLGNLAALYPGEFAKRQTS